MFGFLFCASHDGIVKTSAYERSGVPTTGKTASLHGNHLRLAESFEDDGHPAGGPP
jgi:hypothetical protein